MTRVTIDADLERKLLGFRREIELCDSDGHVVARVKPVLDASDFDPLTPPASSEELDRRSKSSESELLHSGDAGLLREALMFEVDWIETAVHRLADAWISADPARRAAITTASHQIDGTLRINPSEAGESRDLNRRILVEDPLAAIYEVDEARNLVTVLDVLIRKPRS